MKTTLTIVILAALAACSGTTESTTATPRHSVSAVAPAPVSPQPAPTPLGESIYELGLGLTDMRGASIQLDIGRGHPTVISMFYGSCTTACPAIIGYLRGVAGKLRLER